MKKFFEITSMLVLTFSTVLSITGCIYNDDSTFALESVKKLIKYMENNDKENIKELFAPNIIKQVEGLDEQINELCEYWQGEFISLAAGGVGGEGSRDYGVYIDIIDFAYDIKTSDCNYRISAWWYRRDDTDENNVGIWYLWVDSYTDDETPNSIGKWENYEVGITII